MSAKIRYTDEAIEAKVIQDFLPPPEELAFREEGVKVTIALSKKSVEFFKSEATKHHTQYQRMIRRLIDTYVETYDKPLASSSTTRTPRKARASK
jgi:predicted DNA binding CopG/RHH family protein